jgi:hypothetical protein
MERRLSSNDPTPVGRVRLSVTVPPGLTEGRQLRVQHGHRQYDVVIPPGVPPGGQFLMEVDAPQSAVAAAPPPVPMGLPVQMQTTRPPPPPSSLNRTSTTGRIIVPAAPRSQAEMKAECPICFEPLCSGPVGVFVGPDGKRVSQHFFNLAAAREWLEAGSGNCVRGSRSVPRRLGCLLSAHVEADGSTLASAAADAQTGRVGAGGAGHSNCTGGVVCGRGHERRRPFISPRGR